MDDHDLGSELAILMIEILHCRKFSGVRAVD